MGSDLFLRILILMGTHGAKIFPEQQVFSISKQKDLQMEWDLDF